MSVTEALFLGIIQGLTEFFPISSSGHLKLAQHLIGLEQLDQYIFFDLLCHLGTLLAILCVFHRDITTLFSKDWKKVTLLCAATLPLFPIAFMMGPIRQIFEEPANLAFAFLFTGTLLLLGELCASKLKAIGGEKGWGSALIIGVFQAIAVIPGVSRSGSTISIARILGWERMEAARFSFLLAIPAILGGVTLEVLNLLSGKAVAAEAAFSTYLAGFGASFGVGWLALSILLRLIQKGRLNIFVWYCFSLGIGWLLFLHVA